MSFPFIGGISFKQRNKLESSESLEIGKTDEKRDMVRGKLSAAIVTAGYTGEHIKGLKDSVDEIAAVVEELSANTEETASSAQDISSEVCECDRMVKGVAMNLVDSMEMITEISDRANNMRKDAVLSEASAEKMCFEFDSMLKAVASKSAVIKEIDVLAKSILEIASQINLISINASIEAAHAGVHGKGFAVVAIAIKRLAEQTKQAVTNIQSVANMMNGFFNELITNSQTMTDFIENRVIVDYHKLLDMGDQYSNDANNISTMVENYAVTIDSLSVTMKRIAEQVSSISTATEENARGANDIAINLTTLTEASAEIMGGISNTKERLDELDRVM